MAFDNPAAGGMQSPDIRSQAIGDGVVLMEAAARDAIKQRFHIL